MGSKGGVDASWLRRRGGVVAGVVGLAIVLAVVAFQLRADGPAVIRLAAGGGGADTLAVAEMDSLPARADVLLWHPVEYRFILDDGARVDAGEARAWTLQPPADLEAAADDLADHFGLGPAAPAPYGGGGYVAGDPGHGGATLWVGPGGEWSYNAPADGVVWHCVQPDLSVPSPQDEDADRTNETSASPTPDAQDRDTQAPDGVTSDGEDAADGDADERNEPKVLLAPDGECEPPTPPSGVPTEAEARDLAEQLFADLGLPGEVTVDEVRADEWGAWVDGGTRLDGVPTDLPITAGWGGEAALTSISATLAEPTDAGNYPIVDAERAVQRLEEQGGGWGGPPIARPLPAVESLDAPTRSDNAASSMASSSEESDAPDADPTPMPTEPVVDLPLPDPDAEPELVEVTLVDVAPALLLQWDVDGTAWLLPGYRFTDAEGGIWQVVAVSDDYLDTGEPDAPDGSGPAVTDPAAPEPGVVPDPTDGANGEGSEPEPGGGVSGGPGDEVPPSDGGAVDPGEEMPGGAPDPGATPEAQDLAHRMIGMAEDDAVELAESAGLVTRVVERDGESLPRTDDLRPDRVNLHVDDGIVVHTALG